MNKVISIFDLIFGCRHSQMSRVFTIEGRTYRVCCKCGAEFDYSLEYMAMRSSLLRAPHTDAVAVSRSVNHRAPTKHTVESLI